TLSGSPRSAARLPRPHTSSSWWLQSWPCSASPWRGCSPPALPRPTRIGLHDGRRHLLPLLACFPHHTPIMYKSIESMLQAAAESGRSLPDVVLHAEAEESGRPLPEIRERVRR